jgi:hypothetical protein
MRLRSPDSYWPGPYADGAWRSAQEQPDKDGSICALDADARHAGQKVNQWELVMGAILNAGT